MSEPEPEPLLNTARTSSSAGSSDEKKDGEWITIDDPPSPSQSPSSPKPKPKHKKEPTIITSVGEKIDAGVLSTTSAKDLKNEISILNELLPAPQKSSCTSSSTSTSNNKDHPVQQVLQTVHKSVVLPVQSGMEQHVKPHFAKAQQTVQEWHRQTTVGMQDIGSSTRSLIQERVQPGIQNVQRGTLEGLENVKKGTVEGFETVKRGTVEGLQTTHQALVDLPKTSQAILEDHVLPTVKAVKTNTTRSVEELKQTSVRSYQTHLHPHVKRVQIVHTTHSNKYMGQAPALFDPLETRLSMILLEAALRSLGQVIFCDNPVTGALIGVGMAIGSPTTALCALSCVVALTYCASYLDLAPLTELKTGNIGGINAVLVGAGCAAFFHFEHPWWGWIGSWIMATFVLSPLTLMVYLHCQRYLPTGIPPLLIPYNVVMILTLVATVLWDRALVVPAVDVTSPETMPTSHYHIGLATWNGISAIFLVDGIVPGLLMVLGALLCSRIVAFSLLMGSLLATLVGWWLAIPIVVFEAGAAGYNAALTTAALVYYLEPSWTLVGVGVFVLVVCELLEAMAAALFWDILKLPITLTLGFCAATIAVLILDKEESCSRLGVLQRNEGELTIPEDVWKRRIYPLESTWKHDHDDGDDEEKADEPAKEEESLIDLLAPIGAADSATTGVQVSTGSLVEEETNEDVPTETTPLVTKELNV